MVRVAAVKDSCENCCARILKWTVSWKAKATSTTKQINSTGLTSLPKIHRSSGIKHDSRAKGLAEVREKLTRDRLDKADKISRPCFGAQLFSSIIEGSNNMVLSLKNLPPGIYLLKVSQGNYSSVVKVVRN